MNDPADLPVIQRLGVLDRGESAVRVLHAVGGLNGAGDAPPVTTVLIHRDPPDPAPWDGREADEVRSFAADASESEIVDLLQRAQIDTVWIGEWSPGPRADLVGACELGGIAVVGPDATTIRRLADPDVVRALPGGDTTLDPQTRARTIEVDVLADAYGSVWIVDSRDASVTRAGASLIAEAPCTTLGGGVCSRIRAAAADLVRSVDYRGAATVVYRSDGGRFALVEVDVVAAPEHATAEERTGASIIGWRLRIQRGEVLPADAPPDDGVAVEARLIAVDPDAGFGATPGRLMLLSFPVGTGVRIDANRRVGDLVDADDPLIAVFTAWGPDRIVALERVRRALARSSAVIDGGATNRTFLLDVLGRADFVAGEVDDGWLDRMIGERSEPEPNEVALLAAAAAAYEDDRCHAQEAFYASAERGRPQQPIQVGDGIELSHGGTTYRFDIDRVGPRRYSIRCGADTADITVDELDRYERRVTCGGRRHRLVVIPTETGFRIELGAAAQVIDREDGVALRAGWPALVVSSLVEPGDMVAAGDPIAVLESMKMETTVIAPMAGEVVAVSIMANAQVERGAPMVRLRAHGAAVSSRPGGMARVDLSGLRVQIDPTRKPCDRVYTPLGDYLLGYDLSPAALRKLLTKQRRLAEIADPNDAALLACEDGLLDIYAELGALYRPQTEAETDESAPTEHTQEFLLSFLQWLDADLAGLPDSYRRRLERALGRYGVDGLKRTPALESALMWMFRSFARIDELSPVVLAILERRLTHRVALSEHADLAMRSRLDRLAEATQGRQQPIADLARDLRFHAFDEPPMEAVAAELVDEMAKHIEHLAADPGRDDRVERIDRLVWCPVPLRGLVLDAWGAQDPTTPTARRRVVLEIHIRRFYRVGDIGSIEFHESEGFLVATAECRVDDAPAQLVVGYLPLDSLPAWSMAVEPVLRALDSDLPVIVDVVSWREGSDAHITEVVDEVSDLAAHTAFGRAVLRLDVTVSNADDPVGARARSQHVTLDGSPDGSFVENTLYRNLHPMLGERLELWRLSNFELERRPSPENVYVFDGVARTNPKDHRLFAVGEVRDLASSSDPVTGERTYPRLERIGLLALAAMRSELARYAIRDRPLANRLVLDVRAPWTLSSDETLRLAHRFAPMAERVGLEKLVLKVRLPAAGHGAERDAVLHIEQAGHQLLVREDIAGDQPVRPLSTYQQKILTAARFGSPYPHEIVRLFTERTPGPGLRADSFTELDLDADDCLVPVQREPGTNVAHVVVGLLTNHTTVVPEGIERVAIMSDPTQGLGNLAEPECRRVNAALAYALENGLPVEWFAVSSGALIAMDSGTENMDWIALTLRRLIEFTQAGGEVNIIVTGINVGGQPYWNAEATMLTHTKGILVMTPSSAMVLTGKQALDFSGAVSADDNFGIGGYHRVMGPNGQAQYWAGSFPEACALLLRHYDLTYVIPGERFPRRRPTIDPVDRDVCSSPHADLAASPFTSVGDVFSAELNPERKQPFDMRSVMRAVTDTDAEPLERWKDLRDGDTSIVWDATVGGIPVCLLGLESHTVGRKGFVPADGPPAWTSGTLFPHASRKTTRAINAASGNRPLVVLANLSGFDGSPESMRRRQLEYGAEIGRAVTNFDGPIVFVVVSRYHGGAFVVFSKALNEAMEIAAVEGSYASVIGGAPAAATVFARDVKKRTEADHRVREIREALAGADGAEATKLRHALATVTAAVRSEKLGEVADEFDAIHTIERALRVGSVDRIIPAAELRPYVVDALERGMARQR
jgi:biotin carboxylase/acetyl-CoA carboxylase carboxyltransferase component/pyruvate/2-oxoglutarate dehydrogenase complex dihydrolipoamide acyltransferase (E2) component